MQGTAHKLLNQLVQGRGLVDPLVKVKKYLEILLLIILRAMMSLVTRPELEDVYLRFENGEMALRGRCESVR